MRKDLESYADAVAFTLLALAEQQKKGKRWSRSEMYIAVN